MTVAVIIITCNFTDDIQIFVLSKQAGTSPF